MVREFGLLLVAGVGVALVVALTGGTAALVALAGRRPGPLARAGRGAGELLASGGRPLRPVAAGAARAGRGVLGLAVRRPGRVLAVAVVLAAAGWGLDTRAPVESDLAALVPQDLPSVRDLATLQRATGVAGEIDVVVEGRDLAQPAVVRWMTRYQERVLGEAAAVAGGRVGGAGPAGGRAGGSAGGGAGGGAAAAGRTDGEAGPAPPTCGRAVLCPALSLPDLFRGGAGRDRAHIRALLDAVPPYFSRAVITADRRTAVLAFGIKNVPLAQQAAVIGRMRAALDPPPGVHAALGGLPVLAADAHEALASPWRRLATLAAGLLAVGLALLAVQRRPRRAWIPLAPTALATGWSALVLALLGVPLNPMSATLGTLVLAISTEFAVLLCARFDEEREAGRTCSPRCVAPTPRRARPCSPRGRPCSPASRCWRAPTSRCCARSGSRRSSASWRRCSASSPSCPRCS